MNYSCGQSAQKGMLLLVWIKWNSSKETNERPREPYIKQSMSLSYSGEGGGGGGSLSMK